MQRPHYILLELSAPASMVISQLNWQRALLLKRHI